MMDLFDFIFSSFWHFIGCLIILGTVLLTICELWRCFWRHWTIRKHGYPPEHCDVDGSMEFD